ncbi:MAG: acyl-CoA dehydrogenase family protein [Deltaproteobacteria bacterium]|nr:acyl-CoA dehydrogenase family protein [Deltaproteobacteria bacterium]
MHCGQITDFLHLDELYTEEERMARESVATFVDREVLPIIADHYEKGTFPKHLIPMMGEMGLFGATFDGWGCPGVSPVAYGLMMMELERADSGMRSMASVQGMLVMWPIMTYGTDAQKDHWLPKLAKGEAVGCFGLTEPDYGSDPGGMITRAKKTEKGYVLNGSKLWITNGGVADVAVVWAKLEGAGEGPGSIRGFLVEKGTPGYTTHDLHGKLSLRASVTSGLSFDDVEIPEENLLPHGQGLSAPLRCLTQARYGIAYGAIGAAIACYEAAVKYSQERIQFGKPLGRFQLVQMKLAEMLTAITNAQNLMLRMGRLKEEGRLSHVQVSFAKRYCVAMALDVARDARDIHGANGIMLEYPPMRHMCNLETVKTYEGTHDIHTLALGRHITGLDAFGAA